MKQTIWYEPKTNNVYHAYHISRTHRLMFLNESTYWFNPRTEAYLILVDGLVKIGEL